MSGPGRIVSLLPSATEIVCALGAGDELLGVSHECDFPERVRGLPALTHSRSSMAVSSLAIDRDVRAMVRDALSIYSVDERQLAELAPDLIITQDLCQVCAVSLADVQSAVARLSRRAAVRIVSLRPTRLEHVLQDIERVALTLGLVERGHELRRELSARIGAIADRAARAATRPRVATVEWLDPLMLGGTWMPELIELAGGLALGASAGELAPALSLEAFAALAPDVVLIKPCGFSLARSLRERELIEALLVKRLKPTARAFISDGNAFFNRPGPRLVESLEILASCVHPELFPDFAAKHRDVLLRLAPREFP